MQNKYKWVWIIWRFRFTLVTINIKNKDNNNFADYINKFDIIIDGIFGTGLNKSIDDVTAEIINVVNASKKEIISIDIPSGVKGDSGEVNEVCIKASKTVVLGRPKIGNLLYPGTYYCGDIFLDNISIPSSLSLIGFKPVVASRTS